MFRRAFYERWGITDVSVLFFKHYPLSPCIYYAKINGYHNSWFSRRPYLAVLDKLLWQRKSNPAPPFSSTSRKFLILHLLIIKFYVQIFKIFESGSISLKIQGTILNLFFLKKKKTLNMVFKSHVID